MAVGTEECPKTSTDFVDKEHLFVLYFTPLTNKIHKSKPTMKKSIRHYGLQRTADGGSAAARMTGNGLRRAGRKAKR